MCDMTLSPPPASGSQNICAPWLNSFMCGMAYVYVWHDPLIRMTRLWTLLLHPGRIKSVHHDPWNLIHVWYDQFICVWHDAVKCMWHEPLRYSCIRVAEHLCAMTHSFACGMTHLYVWHDPFICVTRLWTLLLQPGRQSSVRHDPLILFMCGMTHSCVCDMTNSYLSDTTHSYVCDMNRFATPSSRSHLCAMTHSIHWCAHDLFIYVWQNPFICVWQDPSIYVWHDSPLHMRICVAEHLCYTTHSYILHNSSTPVWGGFG